MISTGPEPSNRDDPLVFLKLIFFCFKSKPLAPPFVSKHLLIHGIVNNSACGRLGEDVYHIITKIKCFRVAKSGAFKYFFADFNFLEVHRLFRG